MVHTKVEKRDEKVIRVGSRKSELALIQTKHVIARLQKLEPQRKFEIHTMSTIGDRVLNISLPKIGEKSLFTRDLEDALRNGGVDFVVHSLKDLPTALPAGMAIGAVLEREDARDALVLRHDYKQYTLATLPVGSVIGTSSLRRTAQLRRQYPHLTVCDIRGNLNTRLAKLDVADSKFTGIILAQAGLVRMGWLGRISEVLEPTQLLYAVGQGALAVECRVTDTPILNMLQQLMCLTTTCRILAERSFLKTLGGGCSAPVAVWSTIGVSIFADANQGAGDGNVKGNDLFLTGAVWSLDGVTEIRSKRSCVLPQLKAGTTTIVAPALGKKRNGAQQATNDDSNDEPPQSKRTRSNASISPELKIQDSPPVINDDADVESLTATYDMKDLIDKHMDYAMKCPVLTAHSQDDHINNNGQGKAPAISCPLPLDVGQDVMGQCPFVSNDVKVTLAAAGHCPLTATTATDEIDNAQPSTSSKCPFSAIHRQNGSNDFLLSTNTHGKCPFLQKTVQMFDYADEEKPTPQIVPTLTNLSSDDDLFCGLYRHECYKRDWYAQCEALGRELAEELICKGALDVMKLAQAEIHSKA